MTQSAIFASIDKELSPSTQQAVKLAIESGVIADFNFLPRIGARNPEDKFAAIWLEKIQEFFGLYVVAA